MRASTETSRMLTEYYAAMEAKDHRVFGSYYAEDMTLTFGNSPEVKGRDNVISAFNDALDKVVSLGHDLVNAWEEDGGVVFFESIGRWTLTNGVGDRDQGRFQDHRGRRQVRRPAHLRGQRSSLRGARAREELARRGSLRLRYHLRAGPGYRCGRAAPRKTEPGFPQGSLRLPPQRILRLHLGRQKK